MCNSKPLCRVSGDMCTLKIGGDSYWSGKGLRNRFIEMLTNDIFYGGKIALDFLHNKITTPDPRLKILYKHSKDEYILTGEETRDDYTMNKIFSINRSKILSKSSGYYSGEKRGGRKKKRTVRKKRRNKTNRKKRQQRTLRKKKQRRTFTKKIKKDKTLKNNIL